MIVAVTGGGYPSTEMLFFANRQVDIFSVCLVSISLLALVSGDRCRQLGIFVSVGHYAPWEQLWAG